MPGPLSQHINRIPFSEELTLGAFNAIRVCLRLQPEERITLLVGEACLEIAAALIHQIEEVGAEYQVFLLENLSERPAQQLPAPVIDALKHSQVSLFAAMPWPGELGMRMALTRLVTRLKIRHAHMVGITGQIMRQAMRADYYAVDDLSTRVIEKARQSRRLRANTGGGSEFEVEFSPALNWVKTSGLITPEKWGNLPGGEVFTSPKRLDGTFVVDGVVGDYLCEKYGDLVETPLHIEIEDSRIRKMDCINKALLAEFSQYVATDENSNRVGEFAIGTNLAVTAIIGNILQDEKLPGIHIAFGNPYPEHTGQTWRSTTHIDCVGRDFNIWLDDEPIMRKGVFLI